MVTLKNVNVGICLNSVRASNIEFGAPEMQNYGVVVILEAVVSVGLRPMPASSTTKVTHCPLYIIAGLEFRQKIYLSDGQVDLQNHLSVMKSTCPTQEYHKIKRLFNVAP